MLKSHFVLLKYSKTKDKKNFVGFLQQNACKPKKKEVLSVSEFKPWRNNHIIFYILILGENPMKKTLIALSVFAGLTGVAQADTTTLYGRVGYAVNIDDAAKVGSKTALNLKESNIRLGIKGDEQLNNGLEAFYQLEFDYKFGEASDPNPVKNEDRLSEIRQANMGIKGAFGRIAFGKMTTLRGAWLLKADKMVSTSGEGWNHTRLGKVINYTTPVAGGVTVGASMVLDGKDNAASDIIGGHRRNFNAAEAGATFNMNGFDVGVVYTKAANEVLKSDLFGRTGTKADEEIAASIGHSNDVYSVGFDYAHRASEGNYYALGAEYFLDATNTFRGGFEIFDPSKSGPANKNQYRAFLGYQYNFSKRTFAWVEAAYNRDESAVDRSTTTGYKKQSGYTAVVGIRHNF